MAAALAIAGERYARLLAIARCGSTKHGKAIWIFQCDCGHQVSTSLADVKAGKTKSCGCLANEIRAQNSRRHKDKVALALTRHGGCYTPEYNIWKSIKQRTLNPRCRDFSSYGGRGITLCESWHRFEDFIRDMGKRPTSRHSIDRINNDAGYAPDNCRWATPDVQRLNQRRMNHGCFA